MSAAEKSVKTSSVDSGSCQNYGKYEHQSSQVYGLLTPVQYRSSAAMGLASWSLNMPCLKTSLDSEAPMAGNGLVGAGGGFCSQETRRLRWARSCCAVSLQRFVVPCRVSCSDESSFGLAL